VFNSNFSYDVHGNLKASQGGWDSSSQNPQFGNINSNYDITMNYNPIVHRMENKNQLHFLDGMQNQMNSYNNQYQYNSPNSQNAVSRITDLNSGNFQSFLYDNNGNLTQHSNSNGVSSDYQWDDQNRLKAISGSNSVVQHNIFDASGIRTLKADGAVITSGQNGNVVSDLLIDNYKIYSSPYAVVDQFGYVTKHYYSGSNRLASQYDDHVSTLPQLPVVNPTHVGGLNNIHLDDLSVISNGFQLNSVTVSTSNAQQSAPFPIATFYYHTDHLGSSSVISDESGLMYQSLHYLPWGELMAEQNSTADSWSTEYRYNAKEQDEFTGLYDYGARFYDPVVGRFLGVDPLADKFAYINPYAYVDNNPLRYTDPTGMEKDDIIILYYAKGSGEESFKAAAQTRKNNIENSVAFNPAEDIVLMQGVESLSEIKSHSSSASKKYGEKYGKVSEVGVWSHSGTDGPIGSKPASNSDALHKGSSQMSLAGWNNTNIDWKERAVCNFYGCNSATGGESSFAANVSEQANFKGVRTAGQNGYSYPSSSPSVRWTGATRSALPSLGFSHGPTYYIGGATGQGGQSMWWSKKKPPATPMNRFVNGRSFGSFFQPTWY